MESAGYITLSRQSGLMRELQVVANNIANAATTGYRQEGLVFSEFIRSQAGDSSLSMSNARVRNTSLLQGNLTQTNSDFDLAIEGDGFFMIDTPDGQRLTRAGNFSLNAAGDLVTADGHRVLDTGEAPVFVPPSTEKVHVGSDGTISADGALLGQVGLFAPVDAHDLMRQDGVMFQVQNGVVPVDDARILQGFVEGSNVDPLEQMARMVEVQRAYEIGQSFLETEDQRIRAAVKVLIP